jgi:hypothetical protein
MSEPLTVALALTPPVPLRPCPWCAEPPTLSASPIGATEPWAMVECANAHCPATVSMIAFAETAEDARVRVELAWNSRSA